MTPGMVLGVIVVMLAIRGLFGFADDFSKLVLSIIAAWKRRKD